MASDEPKRRLAVIMAADVVGFSRLAERNESAALAALGTLRRRVVDPAIGQAGGRIFKSTGDGVLAEFASPTEAVACAVGIQRNLEIDTDPDVPRLVLRIGIHVGEVVSQDGDLLGDGVNVAVRIEGEAPPGGIALSQDVWRFVEGKTEVPFEDRGERRVKNISRPLRIHVAHIAPAIEPEPALPLPDRPSIAILPFDNLGGSGAGDAAICEGLTEDLITDLSRFRSLFVIARNSSFLYRGRAHDIRRVGRELGVRYVLEGSLRWSADSVRINAQLIDATNGLHVWADHYDSPLDGVFAIQDEVVRSIAGHLVLQLEHAELVEAKRKPPGSLKAYALWLEGAEQHELGTVEALDKAREFYEAALAVDPNFARAHAGIAELSWFRPFVADWGSDLRVAIADSLKHAERAVTLDPNDAHPNAVLGWAHMMLRHFDRARMYWDKALRLNPNYADIAMSHATALALLGEPERGLEVASAARRLNPFAPDWYLSDEAVIRFIGHDLEGALSIYDAIGEHYPHSIIWRIAACGHVGRRQEAAHLVATFARRAESLWVGDPSAGPDDYARWLVGYYPFRRRADAAYLAEGLAAAGIKI